MAREQINPSTQIVLFNPLTQKVLMVAADCDVCVAFGKDTPQYAKVTLANILSCTGTDCCEGTNQKFRLTNYGDGWNGEYIIEQGYVQNVGNYPVRVSPMDTNPCFWAAMIEGDFGEFDYYNLGQCQGGVAVHSTFDWLVIRVLMHMDVPETIRRCNMEAILVASGTSYWYQIFLKTVFIATPYPDCLPYGVTIANEHTCAGDPMPCFGNGTFRFTEWPPP